MHPDLTHLKLDPSTRIIVEEFIQDFSRVKSLDYIDAVNKGNRAVGDTFEEAIGLPPMTNTQIPDYKGLIELKARASKSPLSLSTKIFDNPSNANDILCNTYGKTGEDSKEQILFTTVRADDFNTCYKKNHFKLEINSEKQKIFLRIKRGDVEENKEKFYFHFDSINEFIQKKLQWIAIINATKRKYHDIEQFKYNDVFLVNGWNLEVFFDCLKTKKIKYDFRKGIYLTGKKAGQPHDYGFAFRLTNAQIKEERLKEIFSTVIHLT
jgi:hypothetical protein